MGKRYSIVNSQVFRLGWAGLGWAKLGGAGLGWVVLQIMTRIQKVY